mmetsp:Transcript_158947/g.509918  ORF Transcript_158947/g.509918 Transcript_158947/m.509918 type:complete len:202 (+) Transcript_158947:1331-1936(+)
MTTFGSACIAGETQRSSRPSARQAGSTQVRSPRNASPAYCRAHQLFVTMGPTNAGSSRSSSSAQRSAPASRSAAAPMPTRSPNSAGAACSKAAAPACASAASTTSQSPRSASEAQRSATPHCATAARTTSRSPCNACEANSRDKPLDRTAFFDVFTLCGGRCLRSVVCHCHASAQHHGRGGRSSAAGGPSAREAWASNSDA